MRPEEGLRNRLSVETQEEIPKASPSLKILKMRIQTDSSSGEFRVGLSRGRGVDSMMGPLD